MSATIIKEDPPNNVLYRNSNTGKPSRKRSLISAAWDQEHTITLEEFNKYRNTVQQSSKSTMVGGSF